jgi:hypothetical protein
MKKLSIVLLALAFAIVSAGAVFAGDPDISGKYVIDSEDLNWDDDQNAWWDVDIDVYFTWTEGNSTVYWRAELADTDDVASGKGTNIVDDLWISYQFNDNLKLKVGEYFMATNPIADDTTGGWNVQLMYGMDAVDLSVTIDKEVEGLDTTGANTEDADIDRYILDANFKEAGPLTKLNFRYVSETNEAASEGASLMAVKFALPAGPVTIDGEYGTFSGTNGIAVSGTDAPKYGLAGAVDPGDIDAEGDYMMFTFGLDELVGFGLDIGYLATSEDLYALWQEDFAPFQIILDDISPAAESNANVTAIWVGGDYAYNDNLTLGATYIMASLTDDAGANDAGDTFGSEIDLIANYKFADNVSYKFAIGMFSEGDISVGDATKVMQRITVTF